MAPHNHITQYYLSQAGGGVGHYYAGAPFQKGYGIGSWLGGLFRQVLPLFKSGAVAVGKEAARAGSHVLADLAAGENFKGSAKKHAGEAASNLLRMAKRKASSDMTGAGAIKRRKTSAKPHSLPKTRKRKTSPKQDFFS